MLRCGDPAAQQCCAWAVPCATLLRGDIKLRLRRAVRNLLENARRYSQGDITVVLQRHDGQAQLSVLDRGPGVPPALRERIFEPFFTTKEVGEGTGMGMSICYQIVERHQGRFEIESEPGHGSTVTVFLPIK